MAIVSHVIEGGYNTESGPSAPNALGADGVAHVPWLNEAQNVVYNLDGWPQKMPGATNVNSVTTGATDAVMGITDYWRSTASGNPVQRRVIHSGSQIYSEDGSGTLTSIKSGLETAKMPAYEVMNDVLVIASTSNLDVPFTWDQTTFANLGGSPPNFAFHVQHKDRMWAAGVNTNKSRLYYSVLSNQADWTGAGSGSIDVAPDDGDQITGLVSYKNELIVFKGPNRGRIMRIQGSSPTGSDAFAQVPFIKGIGCTSHQSIILYNDDLMWWDHGGIHSMIATSSFGSYTSAYMSAPISSYFRASLNHTRFSSVVGVNFQSAGYALWTVSRASSSINDLVLLWDYRFEPKRFALWTAYSVASLALVVDTSQTPTPWAGTYTGRAIRMNQTGRDVAGVGYTSNVLLPYLGYGDAFFDKTVTQGRISVNPKGATTFTVGWQRDGQTQQTASVSQGGVSTLAASTDQFTLDTSTLGGGRYIPQFFDMSGTFKELQIQLQQTSLDVDFEPHGLALELEGAGLGRLAVVG